MNGGCNGSPRSYITVVNGDVMGTERVIVVESRKTRSMLYYYYYS